MKLQELIMSVRVQWSRALDKVKPKRDYAGTYPRMHNASPAEAERIAEIIRRPRCAQFCVTCGAESWHLTGTDMDTCKRGHHVGCERGHV